MAKTRRKLFVGVLTFIAGIISFVLGFCVSWRFSVFFLILPGAIVGSAIVISLVLYSLSQLEIRAGIGEKLLLWGFALIFIAIGVVVATFVIAQSNVMPQMIPITVLAIAILGYTSVIVARQRQFYLFTVIVEVAYIALSIDIFKKLFNDISVVLRLYSISTIPLLITITIILMKIAANHCGRHVNFISLLKEFVTEPISKALSWPIFAIPIMSIFISTLVVLNRIPLSSFEAAIRTGLVLVGAFWAATVIAVKLYRECYAAKMIVIAIAILTIAPLIYTLGILYGLSFTIKEDLNNLEPILVASFMFVALFVHAPMMCPLSNKDVCAKFG